MRFIASAEQTDFARSLDRLVAAGDPAAAARAWADGDTGPGLSLWRRLAEQGVHALLVPEEHDGLGATPVEMVLAMEVVGRHALPGPWAESVAHLPTALADGELLSAIASGAVATVAAPPQAPYAVDAGVADHVLLVEGDRVVRATAGPTHASVDRTRHLVEVDSNGDEVAAADLAAAAELAALATAAQLLGAGERVLEDSVAYVKQRRQFGREIGSYQAIKHALADVRIALDFARPLVHGAAVETTPRAVSAAKAGAAEAAHRAARTGLQVHGAIGYTAEHDLSIWLTRIRALVGAWGTPAWHRRRILDDLVASSASSSEAGA